MKVLANIDYIKSLLANHVPLIFCSKVDEDALTQEIVGVFSELLRGDKTKIKRTHPDVLVVGERDTYLPIGTVRKVQDFVNTHNFSETCQLVVVRGLESIRPDAGNALLKLVEESGQRDYTICFITAQEPALTHNFIPGVLPTILSRASILYCPQDGLGFEPTDIFDAGSIKKVVAQARYRRGMNTNFYVLTATRMVAEHG
jgi:DNA polymerase III delta prime subunit